MGLGSNPAYRSPSEINAQQAAEAKEEERKMELKLEEERLKLFHNTMSTYKNMQNANNTTNLLKKFGVGSLNGFRLF